MYLVSGFENITFVLDIYRSVFLGAFCESYSSVQNFFKKIKLECFY